MDLILVKLGIIADLFGIIGLAGLVLLLAAVVWMVISVANFDSILLPILCAVAAVALIAGGLALTPMEDETGEPDKLTVSPGDAAGDPAGEEAPGTTAAPPENGEADLAADSANVPDAEGYVPSAGGQAADGAAAPAASNTEYIYETTLDGWRVRMTLPAEWRDICVISDDGLWLAFSQKISYNTMYGGWLFSLTVEESRDSEDDYSYASCKIVDRKDDMALVAVYATDVQFNYEVEEIMEEYGRMEAAIPGILDSIEFERA